MRKSSASPTSSDKANRDLKIPTNVCATFATNQDNSSEFACVSYIYDSLADTTLLTKQSVKKWRNLALFLTFAVTVVSLTFSIFFFALSSEKESSALLAMALDAFFAVFGALFVLWRFWGPQEKKIIIFRDNAGTMFFGIAFIISGAVTFGVSTYRLFDSIRSPKPVSTVIALGVFIVILGILTYCLYDVARKLNSLILMALTIDTFFACILSFGVFSAELVYLQTSPKLWYLDQAVTIAVSVFFALCGISLVVKVCNSKSRKDS